MTAACDSCPMRRWAAAAKAAPPAATLSRAEGWGIGLLVAASLLLLPLVHRLVAQEATSVHVLGVGFLSICLGWSAGFFLEGHRVLFGRILAALGVAAGIAPLLPDVAATGLGWLLFATSALSLAALALLRNRRRTRRGLRRAPRVRPGA